MINGPEARKLREAANRHLWLANRDWVQMAEEGDPLIVVDGQGARVIDSDGGSWIDVNGGYISVNVGYGRKEIADAAYDQMQKLAYLPQGTTAPPTVALAQKLAEISPGSLSRVFPVSGGSEANETALKIAKAYHHRRGDHGRYKVVCRKGSYHGATGLAMWLSSPCGVPWEDYGPAYPGVLLAPQPNPYRCELGGQSANECAELCAKAVDELVLREGPETVAAVIAEPVAMPDGAVVPGDSYWPMLRDICDRYGVLLIADEVICGFGRTGKMFGVEHWDVVPDIMTVAKGVVSSYLPLGAAIVKEEVAALFTGEGNLLSHVFTSSGHPVSAAAALKNIEIIENEGLVENAARVGAYLKAQLEGLAIDHPTVGDVRGLGLLTTVDLVADRDTKEKFSSDLCIDDRLTDKFKKHGLILRVGGGLLKIAPPLSITNGVVDEIVHAVDLSLWELEGELGIAGLA